VHREPLDFVGFLTLSLGIGALQLMLDRGELKDWFHSSEIWIEAAVAGLGFYLFAVHTVTTDGGSCLHRDTTTASHLVWVAGARGLPNRRSNSSAPGAGRIADNLSCWYRLRC
jgi:hypothetical protein